MILLQASLGLPIMAGFIMIIIMAVGSITFGLLQIINVINRSSRPVQFDEVGREVVPPSHIAHDFLISLIVALALLGLIIYKWLTFQGPWIN